MKTLITEAQIKERLKAVAFQIRHEYSTKDLVIVMVMKGAICIVADLIRELDLPLSLEVIQCSSYGAGGTERGELTIYGLERLQVHNRDVLIVDDMFDSGYTMDSLYKAIGILKPRSIKSCVLLKKKVARDHTLAPDYVLFEVDNLFVVGYGLDYKEQYRGLPGINTL